MLYTFEEIQTTPQRKSNAISLTFGLSHVAGLRSNSQSRTKRGKSFKDRAEEISIVYWQVLIAFILNCLRKMSNSIVRPE